ncbi:hypothetical protein AB0M22_40320 [Nocardia sp. NPDC051756]|uniref:hypothetical protein n=1 Tax=Nocardia sp. NPDC051756 TaxID=3154751 RepID=UPI00342CE210
MNRITVPRLPASAFGATVRYEALLAIRRRVVWLSVLPLCALIMFLGGFPRGRNRTDAIASIADTALLINFLGSFGVAVALADRLAGQRRPGLRELFGATPNNGWSRTAGLILGPWLIASVPGALILLVTGGWLTSTSGGPGPLGAAATGWLTIVAPGSLLLTVLANVASLLLPSAVVRVLVMPFWYWATVLTTLIPFPVPTISRTVLSPFGEYQATQWLHYPVAEQGGGWLHPVVGNASAIAALGFTLLTTVLAFLLGHLVLTENRWFGTEFV